jgi:hypothetical protein
MVPEKTRKRAAFLEKREAFQCQVYEQAQALADLASIARETGLDSLADALRSAEVHLVNAR